MSCPACRRAGVLLGIAIRTGSPLSLSLAEPVWKQLAGMSLTIADLSEVSASPSRDTAILPAVPRLLTVGYTLVADGHLLLECGLLCGHILGIPLLRGKGGVATVPWGLS